MVCHETYKDQNNNWLSPEEIESKDGKNFHIKNNPEKSYCGSFRINVKIKKIQ